MSEIGAPIEAQVFSSANSRAYLSALFEAWRQNQVVCTLPRNTTTKFVPGVRASVHRTFTDDHGWFDERFGPIDDGGPALVAFSSGTTGRPKALLISHRALADVVGRVNSVMGIDETIREYIGVPVTHSFGAGRVRAVAAAGGRSYLPAHGFDPSEIARMLENGEINAVSAVPTLWRVMLQHSDILGKAGKNVRWIEIGSQYMSGPEKQLLKTLFPQAQIVQHYGLTEASRTALLDVTATEGPQLESVGQTVGKVEICIAESGAIKIRGPHLASGLVTGAGIEPITDPDGWLVTADRGRLEGGFLFYEGRIDELINSGGLKIDPNQFEQRLVQSLDAADTVAVGRAYDPLRGERVLVAIKQGAFPDRELVEKTAIKVAEEFGLTGTGALAVREVSDIPRTATGKVQRAILSEMSDISDINANQEKSRKPIDSSSTGDVTARAIQLQKLWAEILDIDNVPFNRNFYDLGGDSLSALTVIIRMEALGIEPEVARGIFDGKTIAELTGEATLGELPLPDHGATDVPSETATRTNAASQPLQEGLTLAETMNTVNATRGVLVAWVVVVHWLPGVLARLPGAPTWIYSGIDPLLRFGTPGFAMVFGLGVGALGIAQYQHNPSRFRKGTRFKAALILSSVLILALFRFGSIMSAGALPDQNLLSKLFYSALSFYALAMLSMPLLIRLSLLGSTRVITLFALMVSAMVIDLILDVTVAPIEAEGMLEFFKILLTARYGYFQMMSFVLAGAILGYLFRRHHDHPEICRRLVTAGLTMVGLGFVTLFEAEPDAPFAQFVHTRPWHLMIYAGVALLIIAGFGTLNRNNGRSLRQGGRVFNAFAISTGILAFPIFVGHELVIPAKDFLTNVGLPENAALIAPLGAFLVGLGFAYRRLFHYFARPVGAIND
ncbi:MAG: hypothetical protein CL534_08835 [Ahrensia sp.]|nr:hypothetical protein [Ahrensia sp.]